MKLKNKIAIVTGGASGLGEATVRKLVEMDNKAVIFDLNKERGDTLVEELGEAVLFQEVNVADDVSVQAGITTTIKQFKAVHILVNCAGIGPPVKTLGKQGPHPLDTFKEVIDINLSGTFNVLRLVAEQMAINEPNQDEERGVIINTASVAAFEGQKGQAAYAASKGGIVGMTLPVARDLAWYGIRVCTIAPGIFHTPLFQGLGEEVVTGLAKQVLFPKRLGKPSEYAEMVSTIVQNSYMNGETIRLDGGIRMQ